MKTNNFEEKLHEKFEDFSVPLKGSQWDRMEAALLEKEKSKKRWWVFLTLLGVVGILSFATGYWLNTPGDKNQVVATQQNPKITQAEDATNVTLHNSEERSTPTQNWDESPEKEHLSGPKDKKQANNSSTVLQPDREKLNPRLEIGDNEGRSSGRKPNGQRSTVIISDKKEGGEATVGAEESTLPKAKEKIRNDEPLQFASARRSLDELSLGLLPLGHSFRFSTYPFQFEIPQTPKTTHLGKMLKLVGNSLSAELTAGSITRNTEIDRSDANPIYALPGITESLEKQTAKGTGTRVGLGLRSDVWGGFSIKSGFVYNEISEKAQFQHIHNLVPFYDSSRQTILGYIEYDDSLAPRSNIQVDNKISFLQIPLYLRYDKRLSSKWRAGISMGYAFTLPLKMDVKYFDIFQFKYEQANKDMLKLGGSLNGGLHLDYKLFKPIWLGVNYQYAQSNNRFTWFNQGINFKDVNHRINLSMTVKL